MATIEEDQDISLDMPADIVVADDEDAPIEVPMDEPLEELEPPLVYDEDAPNIADAFGATEKGREWLKTMASRVIRDWDRGWEASQEHRENFASDWKMFSCNPPPPKEAPYSFCANAHVPIMIENVSRIYLRMSGELFGDRNNVFGVMPLGKDDEKVAEILTLHGNWQVQTQIPDFNRQIAHRGIMTFLIAGDVTSRSYYNTRSRLNCHDILTPDEFVKPFAYVTTRSDYGDLPWYAYRCNKYRHELEAEMDNWTGVAELLAEANTPRLSDEPDAPIAREMAELTGQQIDDEEVAPYKLIWWEGWESIPQSEGAAELMPTPEGELEPLPPKQRFLQVIVDYATKRVLKLAIHEMPNWQERERYRLQMGELEAFRAAQAQHQQMVDAQRAQVEQRATPIAAASQAGELGDLQAAAALEQLAALATAPLPPPPPAPSWMQNPDDPYEMPEPPRKEPILLFAHAVCLEPMVGNLGVGYGRFEATTNQNANIVMSQFIDSATLANIKTFIASGGVDLGELKLKPGAINFVRNLPGPLKDALMALDFQPANPQMFDIVKMFIDFGSNGMQSPEVLSGEPGKSGETYRGLAARIEQATKQMSVVTGKYRDFVEQILRNNALLNSFYLRDEEIAMVANDKLGQMQEIRVSRQLYERNYSVKIMADLRFTSTAQRIAEADEIVEFSLKVPILAQNPDFQWVATKEALEARGKSHLVQFMGPLPSQAYKQALAQWEQAAMQAAAQGQPPPPKPLPPGTQPAQTQQGGQKQPNGASQKKPAAQEIAQQ